MLFSESQLFLIRLECAGQGVFVLQLFAAGPDTARRSFRTADADRIAAHPPLNVAENMFCRRQRFDALTGKAQRFQPAADFFGAEGFALPQIMTLTLLQNRQ